MENPAPDIRILQYSLALQREGTLAPMRFHLNNSAVKKKKKKWIVSVSSNRSIARLLFRPSTFERCDLEHITLFEDIRVIYLSIYPIYLL